MERAVLMKTKERETEANPTVVNRETRIDLGCSHCPPHRGENSKGRRKRTVKKPKSRGRR